MDDDDIDEHFCSRFVTTTTNHYLPNPALFRQAPMCKELSFLNIGFCIPANLNRPRRIFWLQLQASPIWKMIQD